MLTLLTAGIIQLSLSLDSNATLECRKAGISRLSVAVHSLTYLPRLRLVFVFGYFSQSVRMYGGVHNVYSI